MKRTSVTLPEDLDARLRREAKQRGTTVSEVARLAIEEHLEAGQPRRPDPAASGPSDFSEHIKNIIAAEASRSD